MVLIINDEQTSCLAQSAPQPPTVNYRSHEQKEVAEFLIEHGAEEVSFEMPSPDDSPFR